MKRNARRLAVPWYVGLICLVLSTWANIGHSQSRPGGLASPGRPARGSGSGSWFAMPEPRVRAAGYVPEHERARRSQLRMLAGETLVGPEEVPAIGPEPVFEGPMLAGPGEPTCSCDGACDGACGHPCHAPCLTLCFDELEFFGGAQGFTGPLNLGQSGSFGFHGGVNWGAPFPLLFAGELGMQFGARTVHSNFSGSAFTTDSRDQMFVTAGGFRRVDWGLQGGLVVDYLRDDWVVRADIVQLRGELSWVKPCHHEFGFWFTAGTNYSTLTAQFENDVIVVEDRVKATDLYAFFYRHRLDDCGGPTARFYGGFTGFGEGLLGADATYPVSDSLAFQSTFTFLIPKEDNNLGGLEREAWNVAMTLSWRPAGGFFRKSYYRPLFDVAHNGNFIIGVP